MKGLGRMGGYSVSLTHCHKLCVVVQRVGRVLLDGCNIKRGAKSNNKEERQSSGDLTCHDAPVDSIKLQVMDVVQAINLPEGAGLLVALQEYEKLQQANITIEDGITMKIRVTSPSLIWGLCRHLYMCRPHL